MPARPTPGPSSRPHPTRCSRRSARRRRSRRPSSGSAPRSSSGCWRPARACRPSASCARRLGIARSTLRQALVALGAERPPARDPRPRRRDVRRRPAAAGRPAVAASCSPRWREVCDERMAVEVGVAVLAAERAEPEALDALERAGVCAIDGMLDDFTAYRQIDVRFHVGLAEVTGSPRAGAADDRGPGRDDRPDLATSPIRPRCWTPPTTSTAGCSRRSAAATRPPRAPGDDRAPARHRAHPGRAAARAG